MKICAYCKKEKKLTREHVIPQFIYKNTENYNSQFLEKENKFINSEITIKDVCEECNSGILSNLDYYGSELYKKYFDKIVTETTYFKYDFNKLFKWLLKISFNSARVSKKDSKFDSQVVDYIINDDLIPENIKLFIKVIVPYVEKHNGAIVKCYNPEHIRIRRLEKNSNDNLTKISYSIVINSYCFYFFIPNNNVNDTDWYNCINFYKNSHNFFELPRKSKKIKLKVNQSNTNAYEEFEDHLLRNFDLFNSYYEKSIPK